MSAPTLRSRPHALVIPFPAQGHIGPMMHLSIKLAKEAGFVITFVNTHHHHTLLKELMEPRFREQGLEDIHLAQVVNAGRGSGDTTGSQGLVELCEAFYKLRPAFEELVESLLPTTTTTTTTTTPTPSSSRPPLTCIISDLYNYFMQDVASKFGLKYVAFWTASAGMLAKAMSVVAHGHRAPPPDEEQVQEEEEEEEPLITWIPGVPPLKRSEFNEFLLNPDPEDLMYHIYHTSYTRLPEATCVVMNTFEELEAGSLAALRKDNEPVEIYSVGPLLPDSYFTNASTRAGKTLLGLESYPMPALWKEDHKCLQWLNTQDPGSVMYVSFGSIAIMSGEQVEELALGLEGSGSRVLWVIRADLMSGASFPDGFFERTQDRIFIVEWAPQLQVLAHASVGGFLSHCGWNSTLESISAGVPTLGWPYFSDQMLNNRCLVDKWGLGLEFERRRDDKNDSLVTRDEVTRKVRALMRRSGGQDDAPAKHEASAIRWRDTAREAVQNPNGSSNVAFARLVKSIRG